MHLSTVTKAEESFETATAQIPSCGLDGIKDANPKRRYAMSGINIISMLWRLWLLLIAIAFAADVVLADDFTGLWETRYETAWSTGGQAPEIGQLAIFRNGNALSGMSSWDRREGSLNGVIDGNNFSVTSMILSRPVIAISLRGTRGQAGMLTGVYIAACSDGRAWRGEFIASLENADPSAFMPSSGSDATKSDGEAGSNQEPSLYQPTNAEIVDKSRYYEISSKKDVAFPRPVM
jgi:hypothetical protein